jgi:hypothetical protein
MSPRACPCVQQRPHTRLYGQVSAAALAARFLARLWGAYPCPVSVRQAKYTEAELRAMPDYIVRYLAPMQCMEEVRAEAVRRFVSRNQVFCDTSEERVVAEAA